MPSAKTIIIGSDHAGFRLKSAIKDHLSRQGWQLIDVGCPDESSFDYPKAAYALADKMGSDVNAWGILVCGSGVGVCMAANRFGHIRAVRAHDETTARLSRQHNDANVICLGQRFIAPELAFTVIDTWLNTPFEGGRHQGRVDLLSYPHPTLA